MIPFKSSLLLNVPPTLEKKLDALGALRTLQAQDAELVRQRRAAIAALRRDFDELQRDVAALRLRLAADVRSDVLRTLKYNPDQPRVPAGRPQGGQWTSEDGSSASPDSMARPIAEEHQNSGPGPQYAAPETDTRTDATISSGNGEQETTIAANVTPKGFTVHHIPTQNPLDPKQLNNPIIPPEEQQKIAAALTIYYNNSAVLHPHVYQNRPDSITGAVLPPSTVGYVAYDVPGLSSGRGEGRIIVDQGTGEMYYTNNHYLSFYHIEVHEDSK